MVAPSARKNPRRIGMEQRPYDDQQRSNQQPEDLVAPEDPLLLGTPRNLFQLLRVRLDASIHRASFASSIGFFRPSETAPRLT
jgi:ribosomal protein S4